MHVCWEKKLVQVESFFPVLPPLSLPRLFIGLENVKSVLGKSASMRKLMWYIVQAGRNVNLVHANVWSENSVFPTVAFWSDQECSKRHLLLGWSTVSLSNCGLAACHSETWWLVLCFRTAFWTNVCVYVKTSMDICLDLGAMIHALCWDLVWYLDCLYLYICFLHIRKHRNTVCTYIYIYIY